MLLINWGYYSTFAATIMSVAYGISVKESGDPYISRAEVALDGFAAAAIPGSFMVDFLPFLKYIPSWFPGAGFKRKAKFWRDVNKDVTDIPFERVEEELVRYTFTTRLCSSPELLIQSFLHRKPE